METNRRVKCEITLTVGRDAQVKINTDFATSINSKYINFPAGRIMPLLAFANAEHTNLL